MGAFDSIGSFTIKPTIKELRVSTPTNSSQVTETGGTSTFTVRLGQAPSGDVTVGVSSLDSTEGAVSPSSLTFTSTTYSTTQTVTVTGVQDTVHDGTEDWNVQLNPASSVDSTYNGLANVNVAMSTTDDDDAPTATLALSDSSISENGGSTTVTATLSGASAVATTITVSASPGAGTDFTLSSNTTLAIPAGQTTSTGTVTITGVDNNTIALDKLITVSGAVSNSIGGISNPSTTLTIANDDFPTMTIDSPSVAEGDSGSAPLTFTVTLSTATPQQVTVSYADAGTGTATSGTDYTAITAGTLTFAANETSKTITVEVTGDTLFEEGNETIQVTLTSPVKATFSGGATSITGTGTITDDAPPGLVIVPTELAMEEATTNPATHMKTYTVKLATDPTAAVTVTVANDDPGAVTIAPTTPLLFTMTDWATAQTVTVKAVVDAGDYRHETVTLRHTVSSLDTSYASLSADVTVTVKDKDTPPPLGPGENTMINGHTVTVTSTGEPPAVTVTSPRNLDGAMTVEITPAAETVPRESTRFALGAEATHRTVVDIAVSGAGLATVQTEGLEICLPVRDELRAEARALERLPLQFLHYQNGAWMEVENSDDQGEQICATVTDFSPFAVGYRDEKPKFLRKDVKLMYTTGKEESQTLPKAEGGDGTITYELTMTPALPAGLMYKKPDGAEHGGTVTGTPTTPTDQPQTYTLTATDKDDDKATLSFTIEVKPGIQSRDLDLVLAGVGRTLASDAVEILGGRFGSSPASRLQVTLGGQVLRLTNPPASPSPSSPPPSPLSSSPSPLAGEGRGEGGVLRGEGGVLKGEGSLLQGKAQKSSARPAGSSPWQQATGLALSVARALGVNLDNSPSPLAGEGRGEGVFSGGEGAFLQNETSRLGRLPTDLRRTTTSSPLGLQPVSGKDLLARSAFELPLTRTGDAGVPAWTLWGRGSAAGFSGQPEADFKMDGTLYSGYVGVDYRPQATMLLGLALAHSTGDVSYERTGATKAGADVELTSVLPYAHWQPRPGLGVWGLAGAGWGEMDLKLVGDAQTYTTRLTSWLGAVGGRQALTTWQGIDLAAKTDAFLTTVRSAGKTNLPAARGHAQRVRLLVEGRTAVEVSSVSRLEPRLELGGRWDNGTAEQGLGSELGGGVAYTRTDWGLSVDAQGRYLLLHEDGAFEDWGASMSVRLDPGVAGQGAYLTVAPVWGQASSGVEQLWGTAAVLPQGSNTSQPATGWQPHRLEVDLGYGLALADGRGLVTPYGGLALAGPGSSRYRLGSRLALSSSLDVTLEGERAEQRGQKPAHGVSVRLGWQW